MSQWTVETVKPVAHILMAAAHADGQLQAEEEALIHLILANLLGADPLPEELVAHMGLFNADQFDLQRTCQALPLEGPDGRRRLLEMVAQVTEVDDVHDLDENHYILQVARAIGAAPAEYQDLTFETSFGGAPPLPRS